ncbi:hypothetical protein SAMN06295967_11840 [Belliella buryatensis]|uniref:Uncharacterized protein n=1 Tax=Belliella buryatensis TaxID=1500549 RepID=A0A239GQS2_9BACT|nr:hypothetical protein SAMN06295967_11840 [Belliella buryatensis]
MLQILKFEASDTYFTKKTEYYLKSENKFTYVCG